jgi:PKD domain
MRRLALTLLVLLLAASPASALADDQLRIEPEGRDPVTLAISQLGEPDVQARPYLLPGTTQPVPITGYSLDRVLRVADVDPYQFDSLTIAGTSGTAQLTRDEAIGDVTFPEGPPVFYVENGDARFLRPARGTEPAQLASGGPMAVQIAALDELSVSATASPRRVKAGEKVRFTATVTGAPAGESPVIEWNFDDGRGDTGSPVTHRFRRPGTYKVTVGATTTGDRVGADDFVTVRVGKAPGGPDRPGGGTNPDENAPDSGAGTGTGGTEAPSTPAAPAPVTPAAPTTPSTPSTPYEPVDEPPQPEQQDPGQSENPVETEDEADGLEPVEGIELADLSALSSQAGRDAVEAARRGREREEENRDEGVPNGVWWFLSISGLLGLGGLLERGRRPRPSRA